ncbi:protein phosphatase 1 inhibitor domain-containing protein [Phthorimaea operculella]|nr:protein phosphatase 1 inhibitor domain-containing protein [Phthorimaea operculella]
MSLVDDNSSENYGGMFENGHWDWDEEKNELKFISYATDEDICEISQGPPTGAVQFRDDFDYHEQIIQVMASRKKKLDKTVRTPNSDEIENEYRDNLCDLRLLVAKQYCTINIGSCDMKRYHHMGSDKRKTLSHRDARLCETFLRMCVEIVYIALGRVSYNIIETEVHRLFKTEKFITVARNNPNDFITNMTPEERNVFLGHCLRNDTKLKACSPMVNEVFCHRQKDYRLLSLADVKHDK